jgi:cytochrome c2
MKYLRLWAVVVPAALCGVVAAQDKSGDIERGREIFEMRCELCHEVESTDKKIGPGLKDIKNGRLPSGKDATHDNVKGNVNTPLSKTIF